MKRFKVVSFCLYCSVEIDKLFQNQFATITIENNNWFKTLITSYLRRTIRFMLPIKQDILMILF